MGFYQIVSILNAAIEMRKKAVSNISQKHDGTIIQPPTHFPLIPQNVVYCFMFVCAKN